MIEFDDKEIEILKKVEDITRTDYDIKDNKIDKENIISMTEDLINKIEELEEENKNIEEERDEYYIPRKINKLDEVGMSIHDFI